MNTTKRKGKEMNTDKGFRFPNEECERARILWTLETGQTPMKRIYATVKHLRSTLGYQQVESIVKAMVSEGILLEIAHPVNPGIPFYLKNVAETLDTTKSAI